MPAPVSMALIVRDEPLLEQALTCVRPFVEEIVVVVTSAADTASIETAKHFADTVDVFEACNDVEGRIENFSLARNRSLDLTTRPWVLWMDADDTIAGLERLEEVVGWADMVRQGRNLGISFPYEYAYNDRNECTCVQSRERLIFNKRAFRWMEEVHEVLAAVDGVMLQPEDGRIVWKHQRHKSTGPKDGDRNLRILRKMNAARPGNARTLYYLGQALENANLSEEAIEKLTEYVKLSGWDDEKYMACLRLVSLSIRLNRLEDAVSWGLRCIAIHEHWGEGYFNLCRTFYLLAQRPGDQRRNWERCVHFGLLGLSKPPTRTPLFVDPTIRAYEIHVWLNYARSNIGDPKGALESVRAGLAARSDDSNMQFNKLIYEEYIAKSDAIEALHRLKGAASELRSTWKHVRAPDEAYDAIERALENPQALMDDVKRQMNGVSHSVVVAQAAGASTVVEAQGGQIRETVETQVKGASAVVETQAARALPMVEAQRAQLTRLDIVFACGDCWEEWSPVTAAEHGIGGSETAVIEMSKRFAARGHRVRVYTSCIPGTYDGVEWKRSAEMASIGKCDVLIAWRNAPLLELPVEARVRWLWVHDVFAMSATRENLARADRVLALSEWHKNFMLEYHAPCGLTGDKVWVTRNGLDLARFDQQVTRDPKKCVYSSSADRGLESLLQMWPRIRAAVPDASLSVMYGFANWEKMAAQDPPTLVRIHRIKGALDVLKGMGVVSRGRVNQMQLAREYLSAGVWTYPTWYTETSCLGAQEAQAAGLILITSPIAALKETVGPRGVMIEGDWMSPGYQDAFVRTTIGALTGQGPQVERARQAVQRYAREHFSWDGVVDDWERALLVLPAVGWDSLGSSEERWALPVAESAAYEGVL